MIKSMRLHVNCGFKVVIKNQLCPTCSSSDSCALGEVDLQLEISEQFLYHTFKNINMKAFTSLSAQDNEELLKFPAYLSMLASIGNKLVNEDEKKVAIKMSHIKTFSCDPMLSKFYKEAAKVFEKNIEQIIKTLPKDLNQRELSIKSKLLNIEKIVQKLGKEYASIIHHSMKSFTDHVSNAHLSVIEYFILPIPIKGLTD